MKKVNVLLLVIICLILSGCSAEYTLTYRNNIFDEDVVFTNISENEMTSFSRFYENSPDLRYDDDSYYNYFEDNNKKRFYYNIGSKLEKTRLISHCFEDIFIIDKDDYIDIETSGENYCKHYDLKIIFKTDKYVYEHNANNESNGVYTWDSSNDQIKILVSKSISRSSTVNDRKSRTSMVIISVIVIIIFIVSIMFRKKIKKDNNQL